MKALSRIVVAIFAIAMTLGSAFALDVPTLTGRVVDGAKVLSATQHEELTGMLRALEEKTTAQVVILTIDSLEGEEVAQFAQKVFDAWKLGQAKVDNGLLIVLAKKERKIRIHPGYGLEAPIPDAEAWSIIRREMAPQLKGKKGGEDDYHAALKAAVTRISALINGEVQPRERSVSSNNKISNTLLVLFAVLLVGAAIMTFVTDSWIVGGLVGGLGSPAALAGVVGVTAISTLLITAAIGFAIGSLAWLIVQLFTGGFGVPGGVGTGSGEGFSGGGGMSGGGGASGDF
jgi:uncharacterized protein